MKTLKNLLLTLFVMASLGSMAQLDIRMKSGTETIMGNKTYHFYDSGGPDNNSDEYWTTWYQHNESYLLHLIADNNAGGIKVTFDYLLVNNDHILIYEGDEENASALIVDLTCNDYSTGYGTGFSVMSHGNMTIRFISGEEYRDKGWEATVELVSTYDAQAPVALMEACDSKIHLLPGSMSADGATYTEIYYTTNGSTPVGAESNTEFKYNGTAFAVSIGTTVKAILVEKNANSNTTLASTVSSYTFTEVPTAPDITNPETPIIQRVAGTNTVILTAPKVPQGVNDTYWLRYTTDGSDPSVSNSNYTEFECRYGANTSIELTQPCTVQVVVRGTTCPNLLSAPVVSEYFGTIFVPAPTISVTGMQGTNDGKGSGSITSTFLGVTIYYTLDGSTPTTSTTTPTPGPSPISLSNIPAGTTIKAFAHIDNAAYEDSPITTFVYMPNGIDGKPVSGGVFGDIVLLDDREPHSWSYYSDGTQPVHSLNPADVKITYFGYGNNTMTTTDVADAPTAFNGNVAATDVAVGPGNDNKGNQFIYLKTLENADTEGTGNYPYTMIPNPFSKRPTGIDNGSQTVTPTTRDIYLRASGNRQGRGTLVVNYVKADGNNDTYTFNIKSNNFDDNHLITARVGQPISYTLTRTAGDVRVRVYYDQNGGTQIWDQTVNNSTPSTDTKTVQAGSSSTLSYGIYRGFYAWRVKSLSSGLTIKSKGGNTTYGVGGIIPAETEIEFVTNNAEGNEIEFEALWAQACVSTTNTAGNLNPDYSYERNFIVGATPSALNVPVTYSSYYPDGTGGSTTTYALGTFTCDADTKFEYMNISGTTVTANNHDLIFGRGISGTVNSLQGINANATALDYMLRIESGTFTQFSFVRSSSATVSERYYVKSILGCDYDRANNKDNSKLSVSANSSLFFSTNVTFSSNTNKDVKTFDCVVKSGEFQKTIWTTGTNDGAYTRSFYAGPNSSGNTYPGMRYITVEGGEMGCLNGGRGVGNENTSYMTPEVVTFRARIKGGTFHGAVFGGAADNPSIGSREFIITNGEILGWVAAGANGTGSVSGSSAQTVGNSKVYVGGNSTIGGEGNLNLTINNTPGGNVFGAGRGNTNQMCSIGVSNVVVADNTTIYQNVYGAGYNGYVEETSNVYILGGTVKQNVFGGGYNHSGNFSNTPKNIPTSNVIMKGGTVNGSVYGGSNSSGTVQTVTMDINGGTIEGSVFGGGYGNNTIVSGHVTLTIGEKNATDSAVIAKDVYGGSAEGTVNGATTDNTIVTVNKAKITGNVYGGGLGTTSKAADVKGNIIVNINGGNINSVFGCNNIKGDPAGTVKVNFNGGTALNVYGGGNLADYTNTAGPVVNINGGKVTNNVFGGGSLASVAKTQVNIIGGQVANVYAGAQGEQSKVDDVLVVGNKTVNMIDGIANYIYGGSFTCLDQATSFVNISGGHVLSHVFGSGYFGNMNGDCYVHIGANAIWSAPTLANNKDTIPFGTNISLCIENNIYAGSNWGTYDPNTGFGDPTITGKSNIYIDGDGYNMESGRKSNYMVIGGSVYGSGTSCDAGETDNSVIIRKYGAIANSQTMSMTRSLKSVQRVKDLVLDASNIDFLGQGDISSDDPTVEYGMYNIYTILAANAAHIALSKPVEMLHKLGSYTCPNVYAASPVYTPVTVAGVSTANNAVVVNHGSYLMVRYDGQNTPDIFGELEGYFYMQEPTDDGLNNEGYIFARPKHKDNSVFVADGGFVSYDASKNTFDADGKSVLEEEVEEPNPISPLADDPVGVQMPYTNKPDEPAGPRTAETSNNKDYRFWRYDPTNKIPTSSREILFVVKSHTEDGSTPDDFFTTDGTIQLPPSLSNNSTYYITGIKWGAKGKDCNPAPYAKVDNTDAGDWMYYSNGAFAKTTGKPTGTPDPLSEYADNPNSTFGFLLQFGGNLKSSTTTDAQLLSNEAYENYYKTKTKENPMARVVEEDDFEQNSDYEAAVQMLPELQFLVTYSNRISQNEMWAEATVTIEERDANGNPIQIIYLYIDVTTMTMMGQDVETSVYASTDANSGTVYSALLTLPTFALQTITANNLEATFEVAQPTAADKQIKTEYASLIGSKADNIAGNAAMYLNFYADKNGDATDGWKMKGDEEDVNNVAEYDYYNISSTGENILGKADGRSATSIRFDLHYTAGALQQSGKFDIGQKYLGDLKIKIPVQNVKGMSGEDPHFYITVHVYVTGPTKFYYLDGENGRDGNSGMFPDEAKKTLSAVLNADGYTSSDPIFVVKGVTPQSNSTLSWDASAFASLRQVNVYRYPGGHYLSNGTTTKDGFNNGMFPGQIINIPATSKGFTMDNVRLSGGGDLNNITPDPVDPSMPGDPRKPYNPDNTNMISNYPLISIAAGTEVTIENSSLLWNNNNSTTSIAGAIYNEGSLTIDGVRIDSNQSNAGNSVGGLGTGVYHAGKMMDLGSTAPIVIEDQVYLADKKWMTASDELDAESHFSDIMVYLADEYKTELTHYSGRVIVRYTGEYEPTAPVAPFWKTIDPETGKPYKSTMLQSRKAAAPDYESQKYDLNPYLTGAEFVLANGGDENVLPYIVDAMKDEYHPAASDIIMFRTDANLPVELLYFHATCMGDAVQFEWATASETNNEYFTIERSSDAVNYEEVARIQGAGTTSQRNDYSFMVDNNSTAITYYRLRQTDIDGKYEIFTPIAIQCQNDKAATEISIYPVPANDQVNIFSSNSPMTRIEIYSIMGAKVAEEQAEGNQTTLHIGNLARGVYAVKVFTEDGQVSNVRLIKK
ncbi:MAG: chitobiase/beta-hexosaminidase C-terminal domain-containing protein [Bacteroidales bacterium]|nr:chitobiase/beta-hexosaminidase C-terminal domain-containing protein [Bacteroidales bacterium]